MQLALLVRIASGGIAMSRLLPRIVLLGALLLPAVCSAQYDRGDGGASMLSYGFRGFWTGATLGLATGYLTTGASYEHQEWRNLVMGAGIGAIAGVATGVSLAFVDTSGDGRPGFYVLRDMDYGSLLGALTGAAVGGLVWVDDGSSKDMLTGAAIGTLAGAGIGLVFGLFDGARARERAQRWQPPHGIHITITSLPPLGGAMPTPMPALRGYF
jgi:hypothetical protein